MFKKTIDNKPIIQNPRDGQYIVDFTATSIDSSFKPHNSDIEVYKLDQSMTMRADLASIAYYGTDEQTETILKTNGISNPFSLVDGEVLMFPGRLRPSEMFKSVVASSLKDTKGDEENDRKRQADELRKSYKFVNPKVVNEIKRGNPENDEFNRLRVPQPKIQKSPSIADEGDVPIVNKDGYVDIVP